MFFRFVFFAAAKVIVLPSVTAHGDILPFNWYNKYKIHSDCFPIELKSKDTRFRVFFDFDSIGKQSE